MRVSSIVANLHHDSTITSMNRVRYDAPTGNLFLRINSRSNRIAMSIGADRRSLRDDQTGGGTLCVVLRIQRGRHVVGPGPHSGKRRHDDPVRNLYGAQAKRGEE